MICSADAILRMLHFNEAASILKKRETEDTASPYKILVLDTFSKSIVAPLVGVQDLRQKGGVTLHLQIDTAREAIQDVPAVYFLQATAANIERIVEVNLDGDHANVNSLMFCLQTHKQVASCNKITKFAALL